MGRTFAMINPATFHSDEFLSLSIAAKLFFHHIVSHERIELTGAGVITTQSLAKYFDLEPEECIDILEALQDSKFIFYDLEYGMVLIRKFWFQTTLNPKGLEILTSGLESGEYGRTIGNCEFWALTDLLEELENPSSYGSSKLKASKKLEVISLAQKRLSVLEGPKLHTVEKPSETDNTVEFTGFENNPSDIMEA